MKSLCSSCSHWKKEQAELGYANDRGICTSFKWKFTITNYSSVTVLDRKNLGDSHINTQHFESQSNEIPFGRIEPSRYCLVTDEKFGCIHHTKE